ncbi:MAG TPA: aldehyde dehydrogenase family protein [Bacteroidota bacterium]|nr:aldehyde dehydrogenase family protein [Bacteroidota bacterium]
MREYSLYINGEFVPSVSGKTFETANPYNQEVIAHVARANAQDGEKAIAAARAAFDKGPWPRMSRDERAALLKSVSDKLNERKSDFEQWEIEDSGSTMRKVKDDVYLSARAMSYFSKLAALDPVAPLDALSKPGFSRNLLVHEPVGVVSAIIPWNFPLKMAIWKLGPALAAGNTVVLKPSELTPVTALELARIFHDAGFPPGTVNILPGFGPEVGETLARHPHVDKVSFTGSTAIGRRVMELAAGTLKNCTLECGGKSANIVLEDADPRLAVDGTLYGIFYHQGQCCEAASRLFLPSSLHDTFVEELIAKTKAMKLGDPKSGDTVIGPLISKKQQDRVFSYIQKGKQEGARIVAGGSIPSTEQLRNGNFIEPTIFTNVKNGMTIAQEEIFGPVLSVIRYESVQDAIEQANDSMYGLAAGIWSLDGNKAMDVARQLRAGTVWINEWHLISERAPFGGYKQSGIGREFGVEGLHEYMELKHLHIDELAAREKKPWYNTIVPPTP